MELHTITGVKAIEGDRQLYVEFDGGPARVVDLSEMLAQGGVFEPLRDPSRFYGVEIGPRGRTLLWHVGEDVVDLCADALWLMAAGVERMLELRIETRHQTFVQALKAAKIEGVQAEYRPTMAYDTAEEHFLEIVIVAVSVEAVRYFKDWLIGFFKREQPKDLTIESQVINNAEKIEVVINNYIEAHSKEKKG